MLLLTQTLAAANAKVERLHQDGADLIRTETRINAPRALLLTVLEQPCHVREWMPDLTEVRLLDPDAQLGQRVYMVTKGTLLSQPRDSIGRFQRSGEQPVIIAMQAEPDALPRHPDRVRIPFAEAHWSLFKQEDTTLLHYQQRVAIGGRIPQWLADEYSTRYVARVMESLTKYVATLSSPDCPALH